MGASIIIPSVQSYVPLTQKVNFTGTPTNFTIPLSGISANAIKIIANLRASTASLITESIGVEFVPKTGNAVIWQTEGITGIGAPSADLLGNFTDGFAVTGISGSDKNANLFSRLEVDIFDFNISGFRRGFYKFSCLLAAGSNGKSAVGAFESYDAGTLTGMLLRLASKNFDNVSNYQIFKLY